MPNSEVVTQMTVVAKMVQAYKDNTVKGKTSVAGVSEIMDLLLEVDTEEQERVLDAFEAGIR